jgi:hypothetical protein
MTTRIELPGRWVAAAGGGDSVWCATSTRLLAFDGAGARRLDVAAPGRVTQLAATSTLLVAVVGHGVLAWLDRRTGGVAATAPVGGSVELLSGGEAIWALDRSAARAMHVEANGAVSAAHPVPGIDRAAADGPRLWWTTTRDSRLRDFVRVVDLGVGASERGGMTVCAGSVWVSVPGGLCRVGAWAGQPGPIVPAPVGPVPFLVCAGGVLVGAAERHHVIVLDFSADADVRVLDVDTGHAVGAMVATGRTVWLFPQDHPEAHLVQV